MLCLKPLEYIQTVSGGMSISDIRQDDGIVTAQLQMLHALYTGSRDPYVTEALYDQLHIKKAPS